jgi:hypothetical protein
MYVLNSMTADIDDLKIQCRNWFSSCSCRRSVNYAAHEFGKLGSIGTPSGTHVCDSLTITAHVYDIVKGDLSSCDS